jgi:outer membrane biogenesis lipoprotein LolB
MRRALFILLAAALLTACSQAARERFARDLCQNAPNCTAYDKDGKPVSNKDYCVGRQVCRGVP